MKAPEHSTDTHGKQDVRQRITGEDVLKFADVFEVIRDILVFAHAGR